MRQKMHTEAEIAVELGITQSAVSQMLKRISSKVLDRLTSQAEEIKAAQTAQLEQIASESMRGWERSQTAAESERTVTEEVMLEGTQPDGAKVQIPSIKQTITKTTEYQAGDPRFLDQARGALADIRDIWGLEAPKKKDITSGGAALKAYGLVDPDDL